MRTRKTTPEQFYAAWFARELVCDMFTTTIVKMMRHDRHWRHVWPRFLAIHLVRRQTGWGWRRLGMYFNRHQSNCLHACRAVANARATDPKARAQIEALEAKLPTAVIANL